MYTFNTYYTDTQTVQDSALLFGAIGAGIALCITVITSIFLTIIIAMYRAKARFKAKLKREENTDPKIYEEIGQVGRTSVNTADNVAYASCQSVWHAASCAY